MADITDKLAFFLDKPRLGAPLYGFITHSFIPFDLVQVLSFVFICVIYALSYLIELI